MAKSKHKTEKKKGKDKTTLPTTSAQSHGFGNSLFNVLGIKYQFTNEPMWFRVFVILIISVCIIWLAYLVKGWVMAILAKDTVVSNVTKIFNSVKGRDP